MSPPESPAALLVPEILTSIAQYLSRRDFLQAHLVSRSWHAHLTPLLWHTLALPQRWHVIMAADSDSTPSGFPDTTVVFRKYAHLVRSLACNNIQYHIHYLVPYCANLTELEVVDLTEDALPLLRLNVATLTSIKFKREHDLARTSFRVLEFIQAMDQCLFLDRLRLVDFEIEGSLSSSSSSAEPSFTRQQQRAYFNRYGRTRPIQASTTTTTTLPIETKQEDSSAAVTAAAVALFYKVIHRVSTLELVRNVIQSPPNRTEVFYRLQKLTLQESGMSYQDQLQFISQCQYLTHLRLQLTRDSERLDPEELAAVELETACPRITHLDLSWSTLKDHEIALLLSHLPYLKSFRAQRTKVGELTIALLTGTRFRLREQLEELDIVDVREMQSAWIQRILCSCTGLRRFRATQMSAQDIVSAVPQPIDSSTHCSELISGWACLQLRELQLSIIGISQQSSLQEQITVYDQLSRLTQLQILSLGGNTLSTWFRVGTLSLSLQTGFDRLRTLRELRQFNFSYMAHELGMSEVEFMMEHWTKLRKVVGTVRESGAHVERPEIYIHRKWPRVEFCAT